MESPWQCWFYLLRFEEIHFWHSTFMEVNDILFVLLPAFKKEKKRKERKATFEKLNTSRFSEKMLSGKRYHWKSFRPEKQIDTFFCSFSDLEILKKKTQHIKPKLSAFMFQIWRDFSFPQDKIIMIDNSINLLPTSPVRFSKKNMAAVFENCQCKICVGKCTYSISCWKLNEKVNTAPIDVRWMWS